ncbi:hypothetical protein BDN72DRAFT_841522 [Pluteus cervinus]|uniref:Uncharacterized protein n=1 Tax=Pluteus cervinus TaxID=181527 RepID=A0ACD3ASD4_9AGAR|nr:hypothetical protein BDN72DRAFT_841522 [Pluteus cervinus]
MTLPWGANQDLNEVRKKLDEQITDLRSQLRILCATRNALTPINRVPPEILSRIFSYVQDSFIKQEDGWEIGIPSNFINWTWVSHVSQYWRNVALECASLWTIIPLNKTRYAEEAFLRSKACNITLLQTEDISTTEHINLSRIATGHLNRARHIHLKQLGCPPQGYLEFIRSQPTPVLKTLSLSGNWFFLQEKPFIGEIPQLQTLLLRFCAFDPRSIVFRSLKHLSISSPRSYLSPSTLAETLGSLPNLVSLHLCNTLSNAPDPSQSSLGTVIIPNITSLSLQDHKTDLTIRLFTPLRFLKPVHLKINNSFYEERPDFPTLLRTFSASIAQAELPPIRRMEFSFRSSFRFEMCHSVKILEKTIISIMMTRVPRFIRENPTEWLRSLEVLPLQEVVYLSVTAKVNAQLWKNMLPRFSALEHLRVTGSGGRAFLNCLVDESKDSHQTPETTSIIPKVNRINLRDIPFEGLPDDDWIEIFRTRQERGIGVKKLRVIQPGDTVVPALARIKDIVECVETK